MSKGFIRLLVFFIILGYGFLFIVAVGDYGSELEKLQEKYLYVRVFLAFIGVLSSLSTFCLWGLMLYHWGTHVFKSKAYKRVWFLLMALGMFVGSWFYYVIVFELGKTIKGEAESQS